MPAETVLLNGRFTTLDPARPEATAVAILRAAAGEIDFAPSPRAGVEIGEQLGANVMAVQWLTALVHWL